MAYVLLGLLIYAGLALLFLSLFVAASRADRIWERRGERRPETPRPRRRA